MYKAYVTKDGSEHKWAAHRNRFRNRVTVENTEGNQNPPCCMQERNQPNQCRPTR